MFELYEKYNIVHINGCRYYIVDLKAKEYLFENTVPYCCVIKSVVIFDSSWKNMIVKIIEELDRLNPKSESELLSIKNSWGKQDVFSLNKKCNFQPFKGLYINTNNTAVHAMWTIQLLLNEYSINLDECKFILRRLPLAEPKEIREYEKAKALTEYREFLHNEPKITEAVIDDAIKSIEFINAKVLPTFAKGYHDLFLIENPNMFYSYASKALKLLKEKHHVNTETYASAEYAIEKLTEYIRVRHQKCKIDYNDYKIVESSENNILSDFDDFDNF